MRLRQFSTNLEEIVILAVPIGKLSVFSGLGETLGKGIPKRLSEEEWKLAHCYVLSTCDEVAPFVEFHKQDVIKKHGCTISSRETDIIHNAEFADWFEKHVRQIKDQGEHVDEQLVKLSVPPSRTCYSYKGYIVNGFRFHTKAHQESRNTQNSGVFVSTDTTFYSGRNDPNPVTGTQGYYGILNDIIELYYLRQNQIVLFKCDWTKRGGVQNDETFILATQSQQVFYLQETRRRDWKVVLNNQPRDLYDMGSEVVAVQENESAIHRDMTARIVNEEIFDH